MQEYTFGYSEERDLVDVVVVVVVEAVAVVVVVVWPSNQPSYSIKWLC
jgi:hypothetical protein